MVEELKKVMDKAKKLSEYQQRELAQLIEEEMNWDETIANTQDELSRLADEALQEHKSGKTKKMDW